MCVCVCGQLWDAAKQELLQTCSGVCNMTVNALAWCAPPWCAHGRDQDTEQVASALAGYGHSFISGADSLSLWSIGAVRP